MAHVSTAPVRNPDQALFGTPWPDCAGLRAGAIDTAAAMIVIEVLLDALAHLPEGQAVLAEARRRRAAQRIEDEFATNPIDAAAAALALALIEAAGDTNDGPALAA